MARAKAAIAEEKTSMDPNFDYLAAANIPLLPDTLNALPPAAQDEQRRVARGDALDAISMLHSPNEGKTDSPSLQSRIRDAEITSVYLHMQLRRANLLAEHGGRNWEVMLGRISADAETLERHARAAQAEVESVNAERRDTQMKIHEEITVKEQMCLQLSEKNAAIRAEIQQLGPQ